MLDIDAEPFSNAAPIRRIRFQEVPNLVSRPMREFTSWLRSIENDE
jgi:hypothetical protein